MRLASLAMYTYPPPIAAATDLFWAFLRRRLAEEGVADLPEALDTAVAYDDAWLRPNLLIAQTCGFPYVKRLRGLVRLVATPVYDLPGCDGPAICSFVIVRKDAAASSLQDLRGLRAAINEPGSNTGMNLLRAAIARLAGGTPFFSGVIETGSHLASIAAVESGQADTAAIDCVTFGNIGRFEPARLGNIRVIGRTPSGPGLPFITAASTPDAEVALLRRLLVEATQAPALADVCDRLSLRGFDPVSDDGYDSLARLEQQAVEAGYPRLA